ncbi:MAG TPA: Hsp20/alpha crystallin family protein [bacterium]|nr:Hsp20/alpha crystallin family protein [bacterium]
MYVNRFLNRTETWRWLDDLQREMNRLFDGYGFTPQRAFPAVNIRANAEEALVSAELPGVELKDLRLSVMNNTLTLEGVRRGEPVKEGESVHRQERKIGDFKRFLELPFSVNPDRITAGLKNGILTIRLPRREEDKPKSIQIQG